MANLYRPFLSNVRTKLNDTRAMLPLPSRRDFFRSTGKVVISGAAALGAFSALGERTADAQSGSADYSDMQTWADNNLSQQSWLDNQNLMVAPAFNNFNSGLCQSSDIQTIYNVCYNMYQFAQSTGSPTFDSCCQTCVLYNVPSPGSASSVLFTNPTLNNAQWIYNQAQNRGYGYDWSVGELENGLTVPNISTWNSSNPIWPLCTETLSRVYSSPLGALYRAAHYGFLTESECSVLNSFSNIAAFVGLALGLAAISQAAIGDEPGAAILVEARLISEGVAFAGHLIHAALC